ncbi:MAG: hypothetical protein KDD32_08410 [Bacteroidetes bacterium]|nr:hypothetical protein [Bacteroidota bacterium]
MHELEPYYHWQDQYISEEDEASPFFGREYDEFSYSTKIYNYYIHPQWDYFGSDTLYMKVLFADYTEGYAIMEFIGEWNDSISNDIMFLKRDVIDQFIMNGINRFVLIGENVLNIHVDGDDYYEEWYEDIIEEGGWIMAINMREHVLTEWQNEGINQYIHFGEKYNEVPWRKFKPEQLIVLLEALVMKMLS